ncbi:MAG: methyltransferase domain-containing protein [Bdellovibrionota bacterium]
MQQNNADYVRGGTQKGKYTASEVSYWPCPLCGSEEENLIKTERDVLRIVSCRGCDLVRVNPRLENPDQIYTGNIDIYREEFRMVLNWRAPHHRDWNYLRDIELVRSLKPAGNWLDVGTNVGTFLRMARGQSWNLTGVEPSEKLASLAREWWGLNIVNSFLENAGLPSAHFDIITLTDVFEHVVNPKDLLREARRILKPDGILFLKVPNGKYNWLKFKARGWLGKPSDNDYDAYEHVCHYTHETLAQMLETAGFKPRRIFVETHVQVPVWHKITGHYYQHSTPWRLDWRTQTARALCYQVARAESLLRAGKVGYFAPNIGCVAELK